MNNPTPLLAFLRAIDKESRDQFAAACGTLQPGDTRHSIWRRGSNQAVCTSCGSPELVSMLSPVGQEMVGRLYPYGAPAAPPHQNATVTSVLYSKVNWAHCMLAVFALILFLGFVSR